MTKLTINDREFETDDFNEEQTKIAQELSKYMFMVDNAKATLSALEFAAQNLAKQLVDNVDGVGVDAAVNEAEA